MSNTKDNIWDIDDNKPLRSSVIVWLIILVLICFFFWAYIFKVDEVSSGSGKVIASSKEQIIQSLEGGVLESLAVKEGSLVQAGQELARLDATRMSAMVGESEAKLRALRATAARLEAEVNDVPLQFPDDVLKDPGLVKLEQALYDSRRKSLKESVQGLASSKALIQQELDLTEPLVKKGAASNVEVLRLRRQLTELRTKETEIQSQYIVKAREELAKTKADIESQEQIARGRADALSRTIVVSPVRGVIKDIAVTTIGGVIPPNGKIMEIIPIDEKLLIETKISPRDIAYIRPGLKATVKISAYDYAIYGALNGVVEQISPDTIQDDVNRELYYYRVYIKTDTDVLKNKENVEFPIVPGMMATVDIHTGEKSILDYLLKPFNKAKEALRER